MRWLLRKMKWLNNVYSLVGLGVGSKCVVQSKKKYQGHKFCITVSHSQCVCVCACMCIVYFQHAGVRRKVVYEMECRRSS